MTKKILLLTFALALILSTLLISQAIAETSHTGQVVKMEGLTTLYYVGEDGKRYVFPNSKTYFSWYDNFDDVITISADELMSMPLAGNVRYQPGGLLVKIQTDPKVYTVSNNGVLRWLKTEQLARQLYGANWSLLVDDIPDSFFVNYQVGDAVENDDEFDPEEEEEQTPSIGHNLGLKQKRMVKIMASQNKKRCDRLEQVITRIQKRLTRRGIEVEELGEDYLNDCASTTGDLPEGKKVTLCHIPPGNLDNSYTITVGIPSARAHLAHGDTLGACAGEEPDNGELDTTAPVISEILATTSTSTATVSWTTDEEAASEVEYADESIATASTTTTVIDAALVISHSIDLTGLTASTTYYYIVKSTDASTNTATSSEDNFTTE